MWSNGTSIFITFKALGCENLISRRFFSVMVYLSSSYLLDFFAGLLSKGQRRHL